MKWYCYRCSHPALGDECDYCGCPYHSSALVFALNVIAEVLRKESK